MPDYLVSRSTSVDAPPARVHDLVEDFHAWTQWSPWEGVDPELERRYSGPDRGVGAAYAWQGNRKAGAGSMEITSVTDETVGVHLEFLKPFRSTSEVTFRIVPSGTGSEVTWEMRGTRTGVMGVFGRVVPVDKLVGKDFDKGLARLRAVAEQHPA
ncbi:SRPBCC family protein [Nocardioides korecus]